MPAPTPAIMSLKACVFRNVLYGVHPEHGVVTVITISHVQVTNEQILFSFGKTLEIASDVEADEMK